MKVQACCCNLCTLQVLTSDDFPAAVVKQRLLDRTAMQAQVDEASSAAALYCMTVILLFLGRCFAACNPACRLPSAGLMNKLSACPFLCPVPIAL